MKRLRTPIVLLALAGAHCGGGGLPTGYSPVLAEIEFQYRATEAQRAEVLGCNGVTRIYPSWWGFTHASMVLTGEGEWSALFEFVPIGEQSVRVEPPAGCESNELLVNELGLQAAGDDLVFEFTVHHDGSVTP